MYSQPDFLFLPCNFTIHVSSDISFQHFFKWQYHNHFIIFPSCKCCLLNHFRSLFSWKKVPLNFSVLLFQKCTFYKWFSERKLSNPCFLKIWKIFTSFHCNRTSYSTVPSFVNILHHSWLKIWENIKKKVSIFIIFRFLPFTHRDRPYEPLLHTTSQYGRWV